jgi:Ca-activated chloride channel family protein
VRVHTVGIDRAVNAGFLGRLAAVGQGRFELVESEDRLDEAMEHIHHRINAPLLTGLSPDWAGVTVVPDTTTPSRLGALFPGVPVVISGRYRRGPGENCSVTVRGTTADGQEWSRQAAASTGEDGAARVVWARAHLQDLEDRYAVTWSEELEHRIVDTSLRFGVLCRFTAFVAVDSRVTTDGKPVHQVVQPVEQPSGWEMIEPYCAIPIPAAGSPIPPAPPVTTGPPPPPRFSGLPSAPLPEPAADSIDRVREELDELATYLRREESPRITQSAAREQVEEEFDLLTALVDAPRAERWQHLSGLRGRLTELVRQLRDAGLPAGRLAALTGTLAVTGDPTQQSRLDELWSLTVRELTAYATPAQAEGKGPTRARATRHSFWKNRP